MITPTIFTASNLYHAIGKSLLEYSSTDYASCIIFSLPYPLPKSCLLFKSSTWPCVLFKISIVILVCCIKHFVLTFFLHAINLQTAVLHLPTSEKSSAKFCWFRSEVAAVTVGEWDILFCLCEILKNYADLCLWFYVSLKGTLLIFTANQMCFGSVASWLVSVLVKHKSLYTISFLSVMVVCMWRIIALNIVP